MNNLNTDLKNYPRIQMSKYYQKTYGIPKQKKYGDLIFHTAYKKLYKNATKNKLILKTRLDYAIKKHKKQINELKKIK